MAYYVTVQDHGRSGFLAGPFLKHGDALAMLPAVKKAARKVDPMAAFYAFGTAHVKTRPMVDKIGPGRLNTQVGL